MKLKPVKANFIALDKLQRYYELCEEKYFQSKDLSDEDRSFYLDEMHTISMLWKEQGNVVKQFEKNYIELEELVTVESRGKNDKGSAFRYFNKQEPIVHNHVAYYIARIFLSKDLGTTKRKVAVVYTDGSVEEKQIAEKTIREYTELTYNRK